MHVLQFIAPYTELLYNHTSSIQAPAIDEGFGKAELQNGTFRFLEQEYTVVYVSLPSCVHKITAFHLMQVSSNGHVSLNQKNSLFSILSFPFFGSSHPPVLAPFLVDIDPSRGGLVLYRETQDHQLISRYASEVNNAFPDLQPAFNPVSLFIATWFHVPSHSASVTGVSCALKLYTVKKISRLLFLCTH